MRHPLSVGHVRIGEVRLDVIDCKAWRIMHGKPVCRLGRDLAGCQTCEARQSRNGDLRNPPVFGTRDTPLPAPEPRRTSGRMRGLGDLVATVTRATGIDRVVNRVTKGKCGCGRRRESLNRLVPFGAAGGPSEPSEPSTPPETPPDGGSPQAGA